MPRPAYPTQLRDHLGNEVRLPPKPFAVGGEGAVFDVLGRDDLVAKVYNKPQSKDRCDKLRAMAKLCSPDLLKIAAWPKATLSAGNGTTIDGILMPKIAGYLEIHHLYSVAQRKKEFPEADWGFLLHTARELRNRLRGGPLARARRRGRQPEERDGVEEGYRCVR